MLLADAATAANWTQVATVAITATSGAFLAYIALQGKRAELAAQSARLAAEAAAKEAVTVKTTLRENTIETRAELAEIKKTGEETHILTNSALGGHLAEHALTCRTLANTTGIREHKDKADLAEKNLADHVAKQAKVDAAHAATKAVTPPPPPVAPAAQTEPLKVEITNLPEGAE